MLVTADYRGQTRAAGQPLANGLAGLEKWVGGLRSLFPDGKRTVHSVTVEGERVAVEVSFTATHGRRGGT
jgi:predicted ester cyclase